VPTYATKGSRRYAYYESRKDLARAGDPPATRFGQGALERHIVSHLKELLNDEHALRRLSGVADAGQLRSLFAAAVLLSDRLGPSGSATEAVRSLIVGIKLGKAGIGLELRASSLGMAGDQTWLWSIPRPSPRPFREARIRIDAAAKGAAAKGDLVQLLAEAQVARDLVLANPALSLNQLGKREGRCRTHLSRLLRIAWLSPNIVEAIVSGKQPAKLNRKTLLNASLPIDWNEQERMFGIAS
jgi:site-specific DNA recombinase